MTAQRKMLAESKKPVIIAGGGVWWSQGHEELAQLVNKTGIPVFTRNAARGAVPDTHGLCLGIAASGSPLFRAALAEADLALVIYGINFTMVILNDRCWGMIKRSEAKKAASTKDFVGLDLRETRYEF